MGRQWLYQRLSALRYSWGEGGGEHSTRNFDNSQLFFNAGGRFFSSHIETFPLMFEGTGWYLSISDCLKSIYNCQIKDPGWNLPHLESHFCHCLLFHVSSSKGARFHYTKEPKHNRGASPVPLIPTASKLDQITFLEPKFFCDTFKLVHLPSCQLTRSRLSSRR